MPSVRANEQEVAPGEGRMTAVTIKLSKREDCAVRVVAEVRGIGVSTLLHSMTVAEIVQLYDGIIERAQAELPKAS